MRALRILIQFLATFIGALLLMAAFVVWRLNASPINSTFLTPYIESGIERLWPGTHAEIAHTLLSWDNVEHTLELHADGLKIRNTKNAVVADLPDVNMRLSVFGLAVGQFWPTELTVDHPQIKLDRRADGNWYVAGMEAEASSASDDSDAHEVAKSWMKRLTHAYIVRHVAFYRAVIDVHDDITNTSWSMSVPEVSLKRNFTQLTGSARLELTQKEGPASIDINYSYDPLTKLHHVGTRVKDITPSQLVGGHPETIGLGAAAAIDLPLSGEVKAALDADLDLADVTVDLQGESGKLNVPALWEAPRDVDGFDIQGDYNRAEKKVNVTKVDFDFGDALLNISGSGHAPVDPKYDLDFDLTVDMKNWSMDQFANLWPKPVVPHARDWMVQNLSHGTYDKGEATFNGSLAWNDLGNIDVKSGSGKVFASNGTVSYIPGMPPVTGVKVEADFDLQKMDLKFLEGGIGNIRMQPFTGSITGLSAADQFIDLPLHVAGPVTDIMTLINKPPLRYADAVGLKPADFGGQADGVVALHFPLLKDLAVKDLGVKVDANLTDVSTATLIKGVNITEGALALSLDAKALHIDGSLNANNMPLKLQASQNFAIEAGKIWRQADLSATLHDEDWKTFGLDSPGLSHGSAVVTLHVEQPTKTKTHFDGKLDLTGEELHLDQLSWKKATGIPAELHIVGDAAEGRDVTLSAIELRGPQAHAQGKAVLTTVGFVKSASFTPWAVGRTSANIIFSQSEGADGEMHVEVTGASLDIGGMKGGKEPAHADLRPKEYRLHIDKLYTDDSNYIADAHGFAIRDKEGWSSINLHGKANGEHAFDLQLTPQPNGTRGFSLTCDNFGALLKGFGVTDAVKDGDLKIYGASTPEQPRVIDGTVKIGSFTVNDLPVLALLINATSPFGFAGLVTKSASFERVKGGFIWKGDELELKQVDLSGNSVGINTDGKIDLNSGDANLRGTLVPFSMVNRVLGSIPLIGDILTGGDGGGVLAVSFSITGPLADPHVSVNPVSLLTPGFLRTLFFSNDSDDEKDDDAKQEPGPRIDPAPTIATPNNINRSGTTP